MAVVAFCGLGAMGTPMAMRLVEAGHELVVWNRTESKAGPLREAGASVAATPAEASAGAEVVITMLADPGALEAVVGGPGGIAASIRPGAVLVEMSTVGPGAMAWLRDQLPHEVGVLDAPVLGSTPQAASGELSIFVGGEGSLFERCRPLLSAMGRCIHVGPLGSGAAMKLVANSTLGTTLAVLGEALALADSLGLDREATFEVLGLTPLGAQAERRREAVSRGEFPLHFRLDLAAKDLGLISAAAISGNVELPVTEATRRWFEAAVEAGWSDRDYSAILAFIASQGEGP